MGWATSPSRKQETKFSLAVMQMGARPYIPSLGRFLQMDPIEGGTPSAYVYVLDPINGNDYSGQTGCMLQCTVSGSYLQPAIAIVVLQPAVTLPVIQRLSNQTRIIVPKGPAIIFVPYAIGQRPSTTFTLNPNGGQPAPSMYGRPMDLKNLKPDPHSAYSRLYYAPTTKGAPELFNMIGGANSAVDYYRAGALGGAVAGCYGGALITIETGGWGCLVAGPIASQAVGVTFAVWGFIEGSLNREDKDRFAM